MAKLRRSLSFLRGKKNASAPEISRPIPIDHEQLTAGHQPTLAIIDEDEQLETAIQVSSLHDELQQVRNRLSRVQADNERLEAQAALDRRTQREHERNNHDIVNCLTQRNDFLEAQGRGLQEEIQKGEREKGESKAQFDSLQLRTRELEEELQKFRAWGVRVSETEKEKGKLEEKVAQLEARNAWLLQYLDGEPKNVYEEKVNLADKEAKMKQWFVQREEEVKNRISEVDAELAKHASEHDKQRKRAKDVEDTIAALNAQLQEMEHQIGAMKIALDEREAKIAEMLAEKNEQGKMFGSNVTPRIILALKLMETNFGPTKASPNRRVQQFVQSCSTRSLTAEALDVSLTAEQATGFSRNVSEDSNLCESISLQVCGVCQMPKFICDGRINEFPAGNRGLSSCCQRPVCSSCLKSSLIASVSWGWWQNLGSSSWLACPVDGCDESLSIRHAGELAVRLRAVGVGQRKIDELIATFERALIFRAALSQLDPSPTEEALDISRRLHGQLIAVGRMKSLFDACFESNEPDDNGRLPPFKPGRIRMGEVEVFDNAGQTRTVSVPIFMRFFNRRQVECQACSETFLEINYGDSVLAWKTFCVGFPGSWMWDILLFPAGLVVGCEPSHEPDICCECVRTHLRIQLEQYGRNHCDKLSCPSAECGRKLTHQDVQLFADKETFEKYDRFQLLNNLSAEPNFRWCLREGCDNGQLYFDDVDPHIACESCAFEMCFKHQMPWHEDMTCEQYDSERSEDFLSSVHWIQENSKPCPGEGCGVNIIKGEACFHMTCTRCSFEFCWVCLADWNQIRNRTGYHRDAHNPGCWFRDNDIQPTEVFGEEVEAAAERRRRR